MAIFNPAVESLNILDLNNLTVISIEMQVKSVKIKAGKHTHNGCGIDGEFFPLNGQVVSSLLPEQCRLIGRFPGRYV